MTFLQGFDQLVGPVNQLHFIVCAVLAAAVAYVIGTGLSLLAIKLGARLPQDSAKLSRFKSRLLVERRVIPFDETRRQALRHGLAAHKGARS